MLVNPHVYSITERLIRLIWFVLTVAEAIIALRVLFRALPSREAGFVRFIYAVSVPLVAPFRPIVEDASIGEDRRHVIEISSIIAAAVILVTAYLLVTLIVLIFGP